MITNQRQYRVAQGQAERFRQALAAPDAKGLHPKAARAMNAGLRSQLDDIETELAEYDALSQGRVTEFQAESGLRRTPPNFNGCGQRHGLYEPPCVLAL